MNSLNPNTRANLLAATDFTAVQIKASFELLKQIEISSYKDFVLTEEKLVKFVERCHLKKWNCADIASKLLARVVLVYEHGRPKKEEQPRHYSDIHFGSVDEILKQYKQSFGSGFNFDMGS